MENIYVQFDGMVYQQIVGIPMGTNCAPLIADLFFFLDIHSKNLQITSKLHTQSYRYHKLRKHLESSLDHTPNFCRNLVIFRSKIMYLKEYLTRSYTVI